MFTKEFENRNVLGYTVTGSRMWGTNTESSDYDVYAFVMPPKRELLGLSRSKVEVINGDNYSIRFNIFHQFLSKMINGRNIEELLITKNVVSDNDAFKSLCNFALILAAERGNEFIRKGLYQFTSHSRAFFHSAKESDTDFEKLIKRSVAFCMMAAELEVSQSLDFEYNFTHLSNKYSKLSAILSETTRDSIDSLYIEMNNLIGLIDYSKAPRPKDEDLILVNDLISDFVYDLLLKEQF